MEDEERPKKLPKLGHDDQTTEEQLGPAMTGAVAPTEADDAKYITSEPPPMSKNQLKKLRRREKWDSQREGRKEKRKQQQVNKRERRRQMIEEAREKGDEEAVAELRKSWERTKSKHRRSTLLPLTFVMDCGYDELMKDKERISLASQLTRAYSDNAAAPFRAHLAFSSYNKLLKERFETVLPGHKNWKEIQLLPEDFVHAAEAAKERMLPPRGGQLVGPFVHKQEANPEDGEIIYLSSDSPDTLTELKPYSTYIIGGLVDKNRHKGICYKAATEKGIKTAKLPIGEYIQMASRSVLATNHVVEIMLRWLEVRDWGEAFMHVLPARKQGKLREKKEKGDDVNDDKENETEDAGSDSDGVEAEEEAEQTSDL